MKNFTRLFYFGTFFLFSLHLFAQDTVIVQTFDFNSTTRSGVFQFPNDTSAYEKILMQYRIRCKDGLVSTGSNTNLGCGEWDYSCNTYITDSSMTDSVKSTYPSHIISNFSGTKFYYTNNPTYTHTQYNQKNTIYDTVFSENNFPIGTGTDALHHPFTSSLSNARTQYLWLASELTTVGVAAGDITGIKLDLSVLGSQLNFLKIKIKQTSKTILDSSNLDLTGWTEVFFLDKLFSATGIQTFNFHTPFTWDGSSNLLIDFSFNNSSTGVDNEVLGGDAGFVAGLTAGGDDSYLKFDGSQSVNVNTSAFGNIDNEITVSFWSYGDPAIMPANSTVFEGSDNSNNRQANVHLPWSDGTVYWDCGNDGTGFDRIQKAASAADYEGKWTYWTFTKNISTGSMKIYLNGTLWISGSGKTKPITITKFNIGSAVTWANFHFGFVDEFSV